MTRLRLGLVSETSPAFLNQVKLLLYSLRKNAGALRDVPVTLITNCEPLPKAEADFLEKWFSPIEFKTSPRLGAIPHTSKLNVFYAIEPSTYDLLLYLDCDTVVRKPLDDILKVIEPRTLQFACRRGGESDRGTFLNFDALVNEHASGNEDGRVSFQGRAEWPMFNSGVFLATSETVREIRRDSVELTYRLFNQFQRYDAVERLPFMKYLLPLTPLHRRKIATADWPLEQGSLALACIKHRIDVRYLDESFNSWGDIDFRVLHCFKSLYRFDRRHMFSEAAEDWLRAYSQSEIEGQVFLSGIIRDFKRDLLED